MTRFSGRFAAALIALFTLTLVPILYAGRTVDRDECPNDRVLFDSEALHPGIELITKGPRATDPDKRRLTGSIDAADPRRPPMLFTIHRSFGLPNPLLQPAAALPGDREPDVLTKDWVEVDGTRIPVRYGSERFSDSVRSTAWFMTYRGRPIESPLATRFESAPAAFVSGRWPITLFVASTRAHPGRNAEIKARLDSWVRAAWTHYHAVCDRG